MSESGVIAERGWRERIDALGRRSTTFALVWIALPIIAMTVSRMAMGFIDVIMVARLGTDALAAISPAAMFIFVIGSLGLGVANAVQTFVSQADGRGQRHLCGAYAWQSLYLALAFAALAVPAVVWLPAWFNPIVSLGQHSDEVRMLEMQYLRIALWSIAPSIVCIGLNGLFMGVQKPWVALVAVVASLVTNAVGNWLLIFGKLGFPEMGISGAAYATVIAWCVRAVVLVLAAMSPRFHALYHTRGTLGFSAAKMKGLLRVGAPIALGWLLDIGSWAAFAVVILPLFGTTAMAAGNIGMQLMHMSFMPAIGIGIALTSQVGYAIGEGQAERAYLRTRVAFRVNGLYMGLIGLLLVWSPRVFLWPFSDEPEVIALGTRILLWVAIFQVFDAMAITHVCALRGAGDTHWPAAATALGAWGVFIGGGLAVAKLRPEWGIDGPWAMCTLYIILIGLLLMWRWYAGKWRAIRIFGEEHAPPRIVTATLEEPDEAPMTSPVPMIERGADLEVETDVSER